jgi:N-acetylglucosaminyl-diphospho-decaprenol L-rhamnosyltransferase
MDLSIIVVSYNARADLERCLASLGENPPAVSHELIVVDNGSTDGSAAAVRRFANVRLIENGANLGFAAANNRGIRASAGELLLLLNSDTRVTAGALDRLVEAVRARPHVAVAGPRLVGGTGVAELSFGPMITPFNELRQRRLVRALDRGDARIVRKIDAMTRSEHYPDWVSGACLLVRRADADAVGLLDERYFMYTEDVDFCAAIRARGRHILFTPRAEVVHLRGRSVAAAPEATREAYRRSHLAFYRKHHPLLAPLIQLYRVFFK